jgi:drug/metabolite transporter (DMT)-like permease
MRYAYPVTLADEIKKTLPRNIAGLDDRNAHVSSDFPSHLPPPARNINGITTKATLTAAVVTVFSSALNGGTMLSYLMIAVVLILTVYGQLILKSRALAHASALAGSSDYPRYLFAMFTDIAVLSALAAAIIAAGCWMLAIGRLEVGYAYPFMALTFVLVPLGSALLLNEPIPLLQLFGLSLIVAGVTISALTR